MHTRPRTTTSAGLEALHWISADPCRRSGPGVHVILAYPFTLVACEIVPDPEHSIDDILAAIACAQWLTTPSTLVVQVSDEAPIEIRRPGGGYEFWQRFEGGRFQRVQGIPSAAFNDDVFLRGLDPDQAVDDISRLMGNLTIPTRDLVRRILDVIHGAGIATGQVC